MQRRTGSNLNSLTDRQAIQRFVSVKEFRLDPVFLLLFLHEPLTLRKAIGILLAIASIYLIAGHQKF